MKQIHTNIKFCKMEKGKEIEIIHKKKLTTDNSCYILQTKPQKPSISSIRQTNQQKQSISMDLFTPDNVKPT